jgi:sigma-E factor negative regulatory protein RseA
MRDDAPDAIDLDLTIAIANAIAEEPTILAPKPSQKLSEKLKAKVVQFARPFGQVAIAASAAGVMVLGVQQNVADNDISTPYQVVQTNQALGGIAQPVSLNFQQNSRANEQQAQQAFVEQQRRFQALLQDHKQQMKFARLANDEQVENDNKEAPKNAK